ncbi:MAG TPA: hypothetical protein PLF13_03390 [candidate division Zixibacteria bacterium]|nr:hypothetical protein [candidate division Zixibacteria bacterium]
MYSKQLQEAADLLVVLLIRDKGFHAPHFYMIGDDYPIVDLILEYNRRFGQVNPIDVSLVVDVPPSELIGRINGILMDYYDREIPDLLEKLFDFDFNYADKIEWREYLRRVHGLEDTPLIDIEGIIW